MRFTSVVCTVAAVMIASPVWAQSGREQTKQHFHAGLKHYNLGEFADALGEFKEAYRLGDDPAMLYNIGQCQRKLGDLRSALHSYRSYLRMGKDVHNRAEVEGRIQDIEAQLKVEETKAPVAVEPDRPVPENPVVSPPVAPAVQAGAGESAAVPAPAIEPGNAATVPPAVSSPAPVPLAPVSAAESGPAVSLVSNPEPPPVAESTPFYKRWWVWTAAGVVVAGAVVTGLLLRGSSASNPACPNNVRCQ